MRHALVGQWSKMLIKSWRLKSLNGMWALIPLTVTKGIRKLFGTICIMIISKKCSIYKCHTYWSKRILWTESMPAILCWNLRKPMVIGDEKWVTVEKFSYSIAVSQPKRSRTQISDQESFAKYLGGIRRESLIMICSNWARHSIRKFTMNIWSDWSRRWIISGQNYSTRSMLCSIKARVKSSRSFYFTYWLVQTRHKSIITFSSICKIFLLVQSLPQESLVKLTCSSFLLIETTTSSI